MKAFTLAEMLLIMVLLSVTAALSLPNLGKSYSQLQLQNTVNQLSYTMRYAQSRAITKNKNIRLLFQQVSKKYQLLEEKEQKYIPFKGQWGKPVALPREINIKPLDFSLDFYPNGAIEKVDIQLCKGKDCMVISTQQQRGQIEVFDAN